MNVLVSVTIFFQFIFSFYLLFFNVFFVPFEVFFALVAEQEEASGNSFDIFFGIFFQDSIYYSFLAKSYTC